MYNKMKKADAFYFDVSPGDCTRYEFVVVFSDEFIICASSDDGPQFSGVRLLEELWKDMFYPFIGGSGWPDRKGYLDFARESVELERIRWLSSTSKSNPYTALAAIFCVDQAIKERSKK